MKPKIEGGGGRQGEFSNPNPPAFKGPTPRLEQVVFDYGVGKGAANFELYKEMVAEWMGLHIKHSAGQVSKAIRTGIPPTFVIPTAIESGDGFDEVVEKTKFYRLFSNMTKQEDSWEENNPRVYNQYHAHCTPAMKTKLQSLDALAQVAEYQDGIGLILLVCNVYHKKDQAHQSMLDLVRADKALHIC